MSDLDGARAKVERAKQHIDDLSTRKALFLSSNPYGVTPEYYPEHDLTVYFADRYTVVPMIFSLIAGDAAHNLRSALDLLACILIRRVGKEPGTQVYFPICETSKKYETQSSGKVKGMETIHKTAIDVLKPYGGGNDLLWGLHQLDIADKHRIIYTPVIAVGQIGLRITLEFVERHFAALLKQMRIDSSDLRLNGQVNQGTHWFDNPWRNGASKAGDPVAGITGNYELHQDFQFTFDIALGEPEVFKSKPLLETLEQLADLVSGIIDSFELP